MEPRNKLYGAVSRSPPDNFHKRGGRRGFFLVVVVGGGGSLGPKNVCIKNGPTRFSRW